MHTILRPDTGFLPRPRWIGLAMLLIGNYSMVHGLRLLDDPETMLEANTLFLSQWHSVRALAYGAVLFGITYTAVAFRPLTFWPVIIMVYIGYGIHMAAIIASALSGALDPSFTLILFSYEINWLVPIAIILHHCYRNNQFTNADHMLEDA